MRVLVAVDGSETSNAVLELVKSRPWPASTEVRVLSVCAPVYPPPPPPAAATLATYPYPTQGTISADQQLFEQARHIARDAADTLRASGVTAQPCVDTGDPRDVIVSQAADWNADLIVVGSHGRTGIKRWLLGSVAESVVRHAPCSVEVARGKSSAN